MKPKLILLLGLYLKQSKALAESLRDCLIEDGRDATAVHFSLDHREKISDLYKIRNSSPARDFTSSLIVTGFHGALVDIENLVKIIAGDKNFPYEIVCISVQTSSQITAETVSPDLTISYGQHHGWRTGTVVYENPEKALIDTLAIMSGNSQRAVTCGKSVSGKGTINKGLESILRYEICSAGNDVSRPLAEKKGMSLDELVTMTKTDKGLRREYDKFIDDWNVRILESKKKVGLECRLGALWAKKYDNTSDPVFKVLLKITDRTSGKRLFRQIAEEKDERKAQLNYKTEEEAIAGTVERNAIDQRAYFERYDGYDYLDPIHYDLVIDSETTAKVDMVPTWLAGYKKFLVNQIK